jgi:hypothetical protein
MSGDTNEPVEIPRQAYVELTTLAQVGTHGLTTEEVLDGLAAYDFDAAREWILEHPDLYERALRDGMEREAASHE